MARYRTPPIKSDALIDWFVESGLISPDQSARRVVIDAETGNAVRVYVELFGTRKMLDVKPPKLSPAQVTIISKEDE